MARKSGVTFSEPLNLLVDPEMKQMLIAISYYRGESGAFAGPARDFIRDGIDRFHASLTGVNKQRFESILENVRTAATFK